MHVYQAAKDFAEAVPLATNASMMPERRRGRRAGARNSVCEVVDAIDLAVELGAVDIELADPIAELAVRVLLIGLLR